MRERRYGQEHITGGRSVTDYERAKADPRNESVDLHGAGEVIKTASGAEYVVDRDGALRRVDKRGDAA